MGCELVDDAFAVERGDDRARPGVSASCSMAGPQPTARRPSDDDRQLEALELGRHEVERQRRAAASEPAPAAAARDRGGTAPSASTSAASTSEGSARCTARCCWPARPTKLRKSATNWPGWMQLALWASTELNRCAWSMSWNSQWPTWAVGTRPVMQQQRDAVEVGVDNPGERVQRAGAGGRDADAEPAGQSARGHRRQGRRRSRGASAPSGRCPAAPAPPAAAPAATPDSRRHAGPRASRGRRRCNPQHSRFDPLRSYRTKAGVVATGWPADAPTCRRGAMSQRTVSLNSPVDLRAGYPRGGRPALAGC